MTRKDPFRTSDVWTPCPQCGEILGWNKEDGLTGQCCGRCGYTFKGREKRWRGQIPVGQAYVSLSSLKPRRMRTSKKHPCTTTKKRKDKKWGIHQQ